MDELEAAWQATQPTRTFDETAAAASDPRRFEDALDELDLGAPAQPSEPAVSEPETGELEAGELQITEREDAADQGAAHSAQQADRERESAVPRQGWFRRLLGWLFGS